MCAYCLNNIEPIVVVKDYLVGNLGFYRQKDKICEFYKDNIQNMINVGEIDERNNAP